MDATLRETVRQTAEDFEWLERHCRNRDGLGRHAGELRLAAALTRNVLGPAIESIQPPPLHVAVVGGAGSGKSTTINFLAGRVAAEANPQAGYTRHPTAFHESTLVWPAHLGFIGPLRRLEAPAPGNLDEDVYQVHKLTGEQTLHDFVLWDCPDMTTWASAGYASRLIEISALADVIVYIASDERYNDEVPTQFLQLLIRGGKAVVVVLTKMKESDAESLKEHFRTEVLNRITSPEVAAQIPLIAVPTLPQSVRDDPAGAGAKYRVNLINQLLVLCPSQPAARHRTISNAVKFLQTASDNLLDVARKDLAELDGWKTTVLAGKSTFESRYRNEYLAGEPFQRFERCRQEILQLLNLPGRGQTVSLVLAKARWPFAFLAHQIANMAARPTPPIQPERTVLSTAFNGWLDSLQAESLRRAQTHAIWRSLASSFDSGLKTEAAKRFEEAASAFERQESGDLEASAKTLIENLLNAHTRLNAFRGATILFQIVAILFAFWATFHYEYSFWNLLWTVPLAAFLGHGVSELAVRFAVDRVRNAARTRRELLLNKALSQPVSEWLEARPVSGGSPVEKLQAILNRVPSAIQSLHSALVKP